MSFDLALIDGDLKILANGDIRTFTDTPKLRQDILKIVVTPLGSNRFHPWYGCTVASDIIGRNLPNNMMIMDIETSISQSLDRLKKLQLAQQTTQRVTLSELISLVGDIIAYREPEDPRNIKIEITVYSKGLSKIEEVFTLTV